MHTIECYSKIVTFVTILQVFFSRLNTCLSSRTRMTYSGISEKLMQMSQRWLTFLSSFENTVFPKKNILEAIFSPSLQILGELIYFSVNELFRESTVLSFWHFSLQLNEILSNFLTFSSNPTSHRHLERSN